MQNLLRPKWIFIVNTLPIIVLFFLFYGDYNIIKSLLKPESIQLWKKFGYTLGILGSLSLIYGVYLSIKKKNVSPYYGFAALLTYIPYLYLYGYYSEDIVPFSIPQWMLSGNLMIYAGTFLMPTLAYSLFVLVVHFTSETKDRTVLSNFLIAFVIPISWYVFSQLILPFWQPLNRNFSRHALVIFIIIGTLLFLFFFIRGIFILATKKEEVLQKYQLLWKVPIAIILPLIGLAVNNGHLFNEFNIKESGIFGDFNSYWFYILAIVNGLFVCWPAMENKKHRLYLFFGRSLTFAYTFYFFLVFLPFLPLSIIALVAIGTGFLMLTPLMLFVLHINELSKDIQFLKTRYSDTFIWTASMVGFLVIPFLITANYLKDANTLNKTLDYIYNPDYSKSYSINKASLQKTLNVVKSHKENNRGGIFGTQQPYLSAYFNWLVLDNLILSNTKINTIENIFFDNIPINIRRENIRNDEVEISDISVNSTFDTAQNAWRSWIDLEITNHNERTRFSEYATTLELPEGAWISDYYLYVGDKKEMGILAEKKTAMWIFSSIRNENRDPGILYYLTGNKVAFRVFPFLKNETRKTGIELLHKEPIQLDFDGYTIQLGETDMVQKTAFENENMVYVSAQQKQTLKQIKRKPYFHFVVDASDEFKVSEFTSRIENISKKYKNLATDAKISFVNSYVTTMSFKENWQEQFQNQDFEGGFYTERGIKSVLFEAYKSPTNSFPVIVVVTDNLYKGIFDKNFADWHFAFPESTVFYDLDENEYLNVHSLLSNPSKPIEENKTLSFDQVVLEYQLKDNTIAYLPDNEKASIILKSDIFEMKEKEISEKQWSTALEMQGKWRSQILHPENSNREWLDLVKYSFMSRIMSPVTSYLVVENEAQKALLKKKQAQVLAGNKALDLGEDTQSMSEPNLFVLMILLLLIGWYRKRKNARISTT
ncbi:MAG: MSEP-CTERM sorting domain-containing protein [Chitinophagales bacterium]